MSTSAMPMPGSSQVQQMQQRPNAAMEKVFDVGVGRYDVTITVGPSFQARREQAVAGMLDFLKVNPQSAPFIADLVADNSDWPGHKELAKRLKKMLPPQLQDDGDQDPAVQLQKVQGQMQQLSQQHDLLVQHLQMLTQEKQAKTLELQNKLQIVQEQERTKVLVAEIMTKAQDAKLRAELEFKELGLAAGHAHDAGMAAMEHHQTLEQGATQHAQALEQGEASHQQGMESQDAAGAQQAALQEQSQAGGE